MKDLEHLNSHSYDQYVIGTKLKHFFKSGSSLGYISVASPCHSGYNCIAVGAAIY